MEAPRRESIHHRHTVSQLGRSEAIEVLASGFPGLRFPKGLERGFRAHYDHVSRGHARFALLLALCLSTVFLLLDQVIRPNDYWIVVCVRLGSAPILLASLAFSFTRRFVRYKRQLFILLLLLFGIGNVATNLILLPMNNQLYHTGLLLILLYGYAASRLLFYQATATMWAITLIYAAVALTVDRSHPVILWSNLAALGAANLVGMFSCYATEHYIRRDFLQSRIIQEERRKSEHLLLNILPHEVSQRLKNGAPSIADSFAEVTVLFADIVDFTPLSAIIPPDELVDLLNRVFSNFDDLAEKYELEKIKTIGDAYMAVAGMPEARADHAEAAAEMALAMRDAITGFNARGGSPLCLRIGLNSGPVVAGVIGVKKFIYDLWGDTVNLASRMESHGVPGIIQVTEATYRLLREKYLFEDRGEVPIKGKGHMRTYFLLDRRPPVSGAADGQRAVTSSD